MTQMLNRRSFLKLSSTAAAVAGMSSVPGLLGALEPDKKALVGSAQFTASVCEMCSTRCPIEARVENKEGVFIRGNPKSKSTGGRVCARGGSGFNQLYDPQRIVKPLMRVGARGEGKWKEVSWDEAYTFIAQKLNDIKEKHGAHTVAFSAKGGWETDYLVNFAGGFGSPNTFDHGTTCPLAYGVALETVFGTSGVSRDFGKCKYMINLGHNVYEGIVISYARAVSEAVENGCKLISLDPRYSVLSSKATEWHQVRPGGDVAFVLALINVLISENVYDKKFVEKYCEGFEELKASVATYTPEWAAKECDISAKDIKRIALEYAKAAPAAMIDYGHRVTYTPEEIELRRAIVIANVLIGNIEKPGGYYFNKGASMYNKLAGEKVAPIFKKFKVPEFKKSEFKRIDGIDLPDSEFGYISKKRGIYQKILDAAVDGVPYQLKGWVMTRSNPVMTITNTDKVVQALKKLDFVAVMDIYMSDTAWFADIVLPESTYLERDEEFIAGGGKNPSYQVRQKVVEPIGDTKPYWMVFKELATKMGFGEYFPYKDMDDIRMAQAADFPELMFELKKNGLASAGVPLMLRDKKSVAEFVAKYPAAAALVTEEGYIDAPFFELKTPSKKIQLFDAKLEKIAGRGSISFKPVKMKEDDELFFIQGKTALHTNGHTHNIAWLNNAMPTNAAWIHTETAKKLGIKNGDKIELSNKYGKQIGEALLTEGIRKDTVFAYFGFGHVSKGLKRAYGQGLNCGTLLPHFTAPVVGMNLHTTGVKVRKA
jgi:thiosulfate reductase/polysulfide reductase chain A